MCAIAAPIRDHNGKALHYLTGRPNDTAARKFELPDSLSGRHHVLRVRLHAGPIEDLPRTLRRHPTVLKHNLTIDDDE